MGPVLAAEERILERVEWFTVFLTLHTKQKYDTCLFLVLLACSPVALLHGREVSRGPYTVGKQARHECNPGYMMYGSSIYNCVDKNSSAVWREGSPICLTHQQFKKFCNRLLDEIVLRGGEYICSKVDLCFYCYRRNSCITSTQFLNFWFFFNTKLAPKFESKCRIGKKLWVM